MSEGFSGLDSFQRKLQKLADNARQLDGEHRVGIYELLTPDFMHLNTHHASFDEMLSASPFQVETAEDFLAIPDAEWDDFVAKTTRFSDWQKMQKAASVVWFRRKL